MKRTMKKIGKLLARFDRLYFQSIAPYQKNEKEINEKKYQKKLDRAEELCRKALALCREDPANASVSGESLIHCVFRWSVLLGIRGREEEAEPLLAGIFEKRGDYGSTLLLTECMGLYGSLLCESGRYDMAATVLSEFLARVKSGISDGVYPQGIVPGDTDAVCRGLGNAACAFTYSDGGDGYGPDYFTQPVEFLRKMEEKGIAPGKNDHLKAAYYAASQQLFLTCFETVPAADISRAAGYLGDCMNACRDHDAGLFFPAVMRLLALTLARDCRFADCAQACRDTLEQCAVYTGETRRADLGSLQSIEGDLNMLLGMMNYRVARFEDCIRYLETAIAAFEADAKGRPLAETGYAEAETEIAFLPQSEKCALACQYIALAQACLPEKFSPHECMENLSRAVELLEKTDPMDPFYQISVSALYRQMEKLCGKADDAEGAAEYEEKVRKMGLKAAVRLNELMADSRSAKEYAGTAAVRRRIALRLGLLELYADYTNFEILLTQSLGGGEEHQRLARLHFDAGEYFRVMGMNEQAVSSYAEVRKHTFDEDGKPYYAVKRSGIFEFSLVACASCLVKCGRMEQACAEFREFADAQRESDGSVSAERLAKIAFLSRDTELDPTECAGYFHEAAQAAEDAGDTMTAAELYNQEGICWYNASPPQEEEKSEASERERLTLLYMSNEMNAFEKGLKMLRLCDRKEPRAIDLLPSLCSNLGECHVRCENIDQAIACYNNAVTGFEQLFATEKFTSRPKKEQEPYYFQYGMCFKSLADIYNALDDDPNCMRTLTRAIEVFERLDNQVVRNELAACLNARGVVHFRMGEFKENVADATRAIEIKKNDDGAEINMAIMLKNRSDAYRELGDFKAMQSDLTESIDCLGKSELPDEMLSPFYGSHWFSMGVCQEGLNRIGKAADAYRRAAGYMDKAPAGTGSDAYLKALCHFRRAVCLCRRDEQEYYGALYEYNKAIGLVESMPATRERNENLRQLLSSRGSLYEAFREIDLARADFRRAESLRASGDTSGE